MERKKPKRKREYDPSRIVDNVMVDTEFDDLRGAEFELREQHGGGADYDGPELSD